MTEHKDFGERVADLVEAGYGKATCTHGSFSSATCPACQIARLTAERNQLYAAIAHDWLHVDHDVLVATATRLTAELAVAQDIARKAEQARMDIVGAVADAEAQRDAALALLREVREYADDWDGRLLAQIDALLGGTP